MKPYVINNLDHFRTLAARLLAAALLLGGAASALADVHYVDVNSTNATPPYTNWPTAATNIQDAVDAAVTGDEVVVTNGIYAIGGRYFNYVVNRVFVDNPLNIRSVNGSQSTTIDGGGYARCVYLTSGASLSRFTLTKGYASSFFGGGGVWCSRNAVVSNCVIAGNRVFGLGNGSIFGGGANGGTLNNCTLTSNLATIGTGVGTHSHSHLFAHGGGASYCTLNNWTLSGNLAGATNSENGFDNSTEAYGGGAAYCTLNNCTLNGNPAEALLLFPFKNGISAGGRARTAQYQKTISYQL